MEVISLEIGGGKTVALCRRLELFYKRHPKDRFLFVSRSAVTNSAISYLIGFGIPREVIYEQFEFKSFTEFLSGIQNGFRERGYKESEKPVHIFIDNPDEYFQSVLPRNFNIQTITLTKE